MSVFEDVTYLNFKKNNVLLSENVLNIININLLKYIDILNDFFKPLFESENIDFKPYALPEIYFSLKGTCAGIAYHKYNVINLNSYHVINYQDHMVTDTLAHELCHLYLRHLKNKCLMFDYFFVNKQNRLLSKSSYSSKKTKINPHGKEWKFLMKVCGFPDAKTTHDYSVKYSRKRMRIDYECPNCFKAYPFTRQAHDKASEWKRRSPNCGYTCGSCKKKTFILKLKPNAVFYDLNKVS